MFSADGAGKEVGLLEHHTHLVNKGASFYVADVVSVNGDAPLGNVAEAVDQGHERAFTCACRAYQCYVFTGADVEVRHP